MYRQSSVKNSLKYQVNNFSFQINTFPTIGMLDPIITSYKLIINVSVTYKEYIQYHVDISQLQAMLSFASKLPLVWFSLQIYESLLL